MIIDKVVLPSGRELYVQIDDSIEGNIHDVADITLDEISDASLPDGAQHTSAGPSTSTAELLINQIEGLKEIIEISKDKLSPDEIAVEANISFAGNVKVIPFFATAKSEAGIKISLMWKKNG